MKKPLMILALLLLATVAGRGEAAPPPAEVALVTFRRADGSIHRWGRWPEGGREWRSCESHGCSAEIGRPSESEQVAFYVDRDGSDLRNRKPRAETAIHAAGVVAWGYGPEGVTGHTPCVDPSCSVEAREPTPAERADYDTRFEKARKFDHAIRTQALADAAARLGETARAAELAAEAQRLLGESR